jgi:hypothetical protein
MKRITLIKTAAEIQVAHLYEHLYCEAIRALFNESNLFYYLDYSCRGTTYDSGLVHIEVDAYTPDAEQILEKTNKLILSFNTTDLERVLAQIVAEEKHYVYGDDVSKVQKALETIQNSPWQTLESLTILDVHKLRRSRKSLWMTDKPAKIKTLSCDLVLDVDFAQKNRHLIPIFDVVAYIIQENLARELTSHAGYYREDNPSTYTNKTAKVSQKLTAWARAIPKLTDERQITEVLVTRLFDAGIVQRISSFLMQSTYALTFEAPNETSLFEASGILVGAAGWHQIGTEENIREVLQHTTLQLVYGKEKQGFSLAALIMTTGVV